MEDGAKNVRLYILLFTSILNIYGYISEIYNFDLLLGMHYY